MIYTKAAFNFFLSIIFTGFLFASELHTQRSNVDCGSSSSPKSKEYYYLVIMGCHALNMSKRIKHAMDLTHHGLMFKELIFLSGQRKLAEDETSATLEEIFTTILPRNSLASKNQRFPNHESALLRYLLNNTDLPQTWHQTKRVFIEAPMFQMQVVEDSISEQMKEIWVEYMPHHAVEEWLKREPKSGSILVISDQNNIFKELLPAFNTEIINIDKPKTLSMAKL